MFTREEMEAIRGLPTREERSDAYHEMRMDKEAAAGRRMEAIERLPEEERREALRGMSTDWAPLLTGEMLAAFKALRDEVWAYLEDGDDGRYSDTVASGYTLLEEAFCFDGLYLDHMSILDAKGRTLEGDAADASGLTLSECCTWMTFLLRCDRWCGDTDFKSFLPFVERVCQMEPEAASA